MRYIRIRYHGWVGTKYREEIIEVREDATHSEIHTYALGKQKHFNDTRRNDSTACLAYSWDEHDKEIFSTLDF